MPVAIGLLALAPVALAADRTEIATLTLLQSPAQVVLVNSGQAVPAVVNMRLARGDRLRTQANGRAEVRFDDGSFLRLEPNADVQLLGDPQERGILVTIGNIWAKIQSAMALTKFEIRTPTVVAGVRGTTLRVEVSEEESVVEVDDGEVEVALRDGPPAPLLVRRAMRLRARRGRPLPPPEAFDPATRRTWEFWTDQVVLRELGLAKETLLDHSARAAAIHEEATALLQDVGGDARAVANLEERGQVADEALAAVARALEGRPVGVGRGGQPAPGAPDGRRPEHLRRQLQVAAGICRDTAGAVARVKRENPARLERVKGLGESLAAHRQASTELQQRLHRLQQGRELDPHWAQFRPGFEECGRRRAGLEGTVLRAEPLLIEPPDGAPAPSGGAAVEAIVLRVRRLNAAVAVLEATNRRRLEAVERLRARLAGGPPGGPP